MSLSRRHFIQGTGASTLVASQIALGQAEEEQSALAATEEKKHAAKISDGPVRRGFGLNLFVDQEDVERSEDITFTNHSAEKHEDNPILVPDKPWEEGHVQLWAGAMLYDPQERLFKMWYLCRAKGYLPDPIKYAYATSTDGLHWDKPVLGLPQPDKPGERDTVTNVIHMPRIKTVPEAILIFGCHCNRWEADPGRRYKTIAHYGDAWFSPDGFRWRKHGRVLHGGQEVSPTTPDPGRNRYIATPKVYGNSAGTQRRSVAMSTSKDFIHWEPLETVVVPDERDDQWAAEITEERHRLICVVDPDVNRGHVYGMFAHPYGDHHYVALLQMFYAAGYERRPGWQERKRIKDPAGDTGVGDIQLAFSRDLKHWHRPEERRSGIALGETVSWEGGWLSAPWMTVRDDEVWVYYSGSIHPHGDPSFANKQEHSGTLEHKLKYSSGIGLAKWRLDGFVSADAGPEGGTLITKPMELQGPRLTINAQAPMGQVAVEVLDGQGNAIPGYARADCDTFSGDNVRHTISWNGQHGLGGLLGQRLRLRFHLRKAQLYSYTIGG